MKKPKDIKEFLADCYDPINWVRYAIGAEPSNQQQEVLQLYFKLLLSKKALLHKFIDTKKPKPLTEHLKKYFADYDELLWFAAKRGISWMAGKGVGKDATMAWIETHFLTYHEPCKIPCIMPSEKQLQTITWREFEDWTKRTKSDGTFSCVVRDWFEVTAEFIYARDPLTGQRRAGSFMFQKTVIIDSDGKARTLDGVHSPALLVNLGEGSNVHNAVYKSLINTLTEPVNFGFITFNPTESTGYAHDTHYKENIKDLWIQVHSNSEESSLVTETHINALKKEYKDKPDDYRIYVQGLPAKHGRNCFISKQLLLNAQMLKFDDRQYGLILGIDPALGGSDPAMGCFRKGPNIKEFLQFDSTNLPRLVQQILVEAREREVQAIVVEIDGLGIGVYDLLVHHCGFCDVYGVIMNGAPVDEDTFYSKKEELLSIALTKYEKNELCNTNDYEFIEEMSAFEKDTNVSTRTRKGFKIRGGHHFMMKKIGRSANKAHAFLTTLDIDDIMYLNVDETHDKFMEAWERQQNQEVDSGPLSWMGE